MCKGPEVRVCLGCSRPSKEPAAIAGASWALNSGESAAKPSSQQQRSLGKGLLPKPRRKGEFTLYERCCPATAPTRLLQNLPWSGWGQSGLDVGGELGIMAAAPQSPPGFINYRGNTYSLQEKNKFELLHYSLSLLREAWTLQVEPGLGPWSLSWEAGAQGHILLGQEGPRSGPVCIFTRGA